uniref:Uncharacterized protein n=1 Tax=Ascaris lumbricoides TaxID=6252 RepID=A0A0M3I352_ASCLU
MKTMSEVSSSRSVAASRQNTGNNIATLKHIPVSKSPRNTISAKQRSTDSPILCATARSVRSPMIETARASTPSSSSEQGSTTSSKAASSTKTARSSHSKKGNASEAHILREIIVKTKRKKK